MLSFKQTKAKLLTILTTCCHCWPPSCCGIYDTPCKCEILHIHGYIWGKFTERR